MAEFNTNCPHCGAELVADEAWIGMEVECPTCNKSFTVAKETPVEKSSVPTLNLPKLTPQKEETALPTLTPLAPTAPAEIKLSPIDNTSEATETEENSFVFVCPSCGTQVELPIIMKGRKYECKACAEESIAEATTEKKCPFCGEMIKIHATKCKYCKKDILDEQQINTKAIHKNLLHTEISFPHISIGRLPHFSMTTLLLFIGIIVVVGIIGFAIHKNMKEKQAEEKWRVERIAEQKRVEEEKRIAEQKRVEEERERVEIDRAIANSEKAQYVEETIKKLDEIIQRYPDHPAAQKARQLREAKKRYIAECSEVRGEIKKAKDAKTYKEAFVILEKIIAQYPSNFYTKEAKELLSQYKHELAQKQQEDNKPVCPACQGNGSYSRYWNEKYNKKYTCHLCGGRGKISNELLQKLSKCPLCNGSGEHGIGGIRGICKLCRGCGYEVEWEDPSLQRR